PGFLAPVIPEKLASQELSASIGAPGPHDFAVRFKPRSSTRSQSVHRIPHPTSVTIAIRPSWWDGMRGRMRLIWGFEQYRRPAAQWHDGQFMHDGHAQSARRANREVASLTLQGRRAKKRKRQSLS